MLELPILGLLEEEPMHGYELKKRLDDTLGAVAGVSYGSLYPALNRLERSGAIEVLDPGTAAPPSVPSMPSTGSIGGETAAARVRRRLKPSRRKRKVYRMTARGRELLRELLTAEEDAGDDRTFALKLAFCRHLEPGDRLELFERRRAWLSEKLARVRRVLTGEGPPSSRRPADPYTRSLIEHDREATQREMEWVDSLIEGERAADGDLAGARAGAGETGEAGAAAGEIESSPAGPDESRETGRVPIAPEGGT